MLWRAARFSIVALWLLAPACAKPKPEPIAAFLKEKQAAVFAFLAPDCPLSQSYTRTLNDLRSQFQPNRVELYAVFPGSAPVSDFVATYKLTLPVLRDPDFLLTNFFGATKTPEVFAVDADGRTFYKGAIDNLAPELGQRRTVITEHYLRDALENFSQHKDIQVRQTQAIGCFIEK